ncbi:MAG TPA: ABC transporter ATP-binding protein [Gammaproteobacteria bacterium]|nr:ABC transporter ATP-binding protein [Gammaproteobacteria bacterium]
MFIIDVKNLVKKFGDFTAVNQLSLEVKKGEVFGFLGPNGCGKTTTIRMLCGLLTPDEGEGSCLGYDIMTQSDKICIRVGYMPQHFCYYKDLSLRENLLFIAKLYAVPSKRVDDLIEIYHLGNYQNRLAGQLSGGWKQRLSLAAAMVNDPDLLLLDEPTAGVDPKARREFWDIIHAMAREGKSALVSTHYMDEAERCTRLAYISNGSLISQGTQQEIIKKSRLHTWMVEADDLVGLKNELDQLDFQVTLFGNSLHLSSLDSNVLENTAKNLMKEGCRCKKIPVSVEDVFIHYVR